MFLDLNRLPKLIVILGPTASGKTDLALKLAKKFNGEIVNADSRQIYRGMDIGTGKVEAEKRRTKRGKTQIVAQGVSHYLIDVVNPGEEFTLADYKKMAVAAIGNIIKRGKTPFLVGGTGLYIQAVMDNLEIPTVPPNKKLRVKFEREIAKAKESRIENRESRIVEKWYKKLLKLDLGAAKVVDKNNPRRISRALEVCLAIGKPFSKLRERGEQLFDTLQIGITLPRGKLYGRIDKRVDWMVEHGLIEETRRLMKKYDPILPSMSGIGYKEIGEYLECQMSNVKCQKVLEEAIQKIKYRTHDYARRQMTWFRRDKRIKWIKNYKEAEKIIKKWVGG
jgi:tRNA dimethylallyltransferase